MKGRIFSIAAAISLSACTWVEVTPGGEAVRLVQSLDEVSNCKKLGTATAEVVSKVLFERNPEKIAGELADLARNKAADINGDTIVPISEIEEGKRTFGVYQCIAP